MLADGKPSGLLFVVLLFLFAFLVIIITDQLHGLTPSYPATIDGSTAAVAKSVTMNDFNVPNPPDPLHQSPELDVQSGGTLTIGSGGLSLSVNLLGIELAVQVKIGTLSVYAEPMMASKFVKPHGPGRHPGPPPPPNSRWYRRRARARP